MTDLEEYQLLAEHLYNTDQSLRRDAKIIIGATKHTGGEIKVTVTGTKKKAIEHASDFVIKYKKKCFVYDFIDYETRGVIKFTTVEYKTPDYRWKKP